MCQLLDHSIIISAIVYKCSQLLCGQWNVKNALKYYTLRAELSHTHLTHSHIVMCTWCNTCNYILYYGSTLKGNGDAPLIYIFHSPREIHTDHCSHQVLFKGFELPLDILGSLIINRSITFSSLHNLTTCYHFEFKDCCIIMLLSGLCSGKFWLEKQEKRKGFFYWNRQENNMVEDLQVTRPSWKRFE